MRYNAFSGQGISHLPALGISGKALCPFKEVLRTKEREDFRKVYLYSRGAVRAFSRDHFATSMSSQ